MREAYAAAFAVTDVARATVRTRSGSPSTCRGARSMVANSAPRAFHLHTRLAGSGLHAARSRSCRRPQCRADSWVSIPILANVPKVPGGVGMATQSPRDDSGSVVS